MLQNVVHPWQELWQVRNQADQLQAYHGKTMKYEWLQLFCVVVVIYVAVVVIYVTLVAISCCCGSWSHIVFY